MRVIGLHGPARSGKTTGGALLVKHLARQGHAAVAAGFADELKLYLARAIGFAPQRWSTAETIAWMDKLKDTGTIRVSGSGWSYQMTGRQLHISAGMGAREQWGEDFWVDKVLPIGLWEREQRWPLVETLILTDVRLRNEAERIQVVGGEVWKIKRPGYEPNDDELTESPLPSHLINRTILNNTTQVAFNRRLIEAL